MCLDMCLEMCVDMCVGMCLEMCVGMCSDMLFCEPSLFEVRGRPDRSWPTVVGRTGTSVARRFAAVWGIARSLSATRLSVPSTELSVGLADDLEAERGGLKAEGLHFGRVMLG